MWKLILVIIFSSLCTSNAYKILIVIPTHSKSHSILGDALATHLSEVGHEITYITAFAPKKSHPRVKIVDVSEEVLVLDEINIKDILDKKYKDDLEIIIEMHRLTLETSSVQKLMADKNQQFDVVIAEWFLNDVFAGFSAVFNCPLIWFSTVEPHWVILELVDEPSNPAYSVSMLSATTPPFTFKQRVQELFFLVNVKLFQYFWLSVQNNKLYQKNFVPFIRDRGHTVPSLDILRYNGSFILANSHVSIGASSNLPQNVKLIGGFHIDKNVEPLPQNLEKIIDEAKHGVIFFSLGSNLRSKHFPMNIKRDLLDMFGKLKQTVLWKFEEDLPERPTNVHILNWAPQQSILAHKNCIIFITHGGLLSITESIHFGVPIIGIPGFGDQFFNIKRFVDKGIAEKVDLSYTIVDDLQKAIHNLLSDPKYTTKARELSRIYHDRPIQPGKELVHWVEQVVKTQGAPHLRSAAFMMPWYQKMYLDLFLVVFILILLIKNIVIFVKNRLIINKQKIC